MSPSAHFVHSASRRVGVTLSVWQPVDLSVRARIDAADGAADEVVEHEDVSRSARASGEQRMAATVRFPKDQTSLDRTFAVTEAVLIHGENLPLLAVCRTVREERAFLGKAEFGVSDNRELVLV